MSAVDRVSELRRVRAGDLVANPKNWRTHPPRQRAALAALMERVGVADALLAREQSDGSLILIDGHLRASMDPDQLLPVLVLDVDEDEADLLLGTLDPLAALAGVDGKAATSLHEFLRERDSDIRSLLESIMIPRHASSGKDEIPEVAPRTRSGDLWEIDGQRILCADATDSASFARLLGAEQANLLVTDPPYGVEYVGKGPEALTIQGDGLDGLAQLLGEVLGSCTKSLLPGASAYLFAPAGANHLVFLTQIVAAGFRLSQELVWVKDSMVLGRSDYHYRHEPIIYARAPGSMPRGRGRGGWSGGNAAQSVLEFPRPKASPDHPTQKPVALLRELIQNSSLAGDLVLDPFLGSGSTLVAAYGLSRRGAGIEVSPRYVDVAVARLEAISGTKARRVS